MSQEDYEWLLQHLNEDLPLLCINFTTTGELFSLALYKGTGECISLFIPDNRATYVINIDGHVITNEVEYDA